MPFGDQVVASNSHSIPDVVAAGIDVGLGVGCTVSPAVGGGVGIGTCVGVEMGVGGDAWNSVGSLVAPVAGLGAAKIVGDALTVAAVSEGPLEVLVCRSSGLGIAGKSEVAQPAARTKVSPMKLAANILRKLSFGFGHP